MSGNCPGSSLHRGYARCQVPQGCLEKCLRCCWWSCGVVARWHSTFRCEILGSPYGSFLMAVLSWYDVRCVRMHVFASTAGCKFPSQGPRAVTQGTLSSSSEIWLGLVWSVPIFPRFHRTGWNDAVAPTRQGSGESHTHTGCKDINIFLKHMSQQTLFLFFSEKSWILFSPHSFWTFPITALHRTVHRSTSRRCASGILWTCWAVWSEGLGWRGRMFKLPKTCFNTAKTAKWIRFVSPLLELSWDEPFWFRSMPT